MTTEFIAQGRIVWGNPGKAQKKTDPRTKEVKLNAQTGQPIEQWVFGLAIPKEEFNANVWPHMHAEGAAAFPNGVPANFSWKFKDGDTDTDGKGKSYAEYEGRAGCMILTVSTEAYAPELFKMNPTTGKYDPLPPEGIKCGDFVAVKVNCKFNGATGLNTPGVYVNPEGIIHVMYGDEIVTSGFDADDAFAGFVPTTPVGGTAQPSMSTAAPLPGAMQAPAPTAQPAAPAPASYAQPAPTAQPAAPAPAYDYVANATGQAPVPPTPAVPAAPVPGAPATAVPGQPPALPGVPATDEIPY